MCTVCHGPTSTECSACVADVIYVNSTCTLDCHEFPRHYPDKGQLKCKICHDICKECFGGTNLDCYDCVDGYYLKNRVCTVCNEACTVCFGGLAS